MSLRKPRQRRYSIPPLVTEAPEERWSSEDVGRHKSQFLGDHALDAREAKRKLSEEEANPSNRAKTTRREEGKKPHHSSVDQPTEKGNTFLDDPLTKPRLAQSMEGESTGQPAGDVCHGPLAPGSGSATPAGRSPPAAGLQVQEIASEQWEGLICPPLARLRSQPPSFLVQEVDSDETCSDSDSEAAPRPRHDDSAMRIVEEETLHFAAVEEEQQGTWEEPLSETDDLVVFPVRGSPRFIEVPNERAVFSTLRANRRVIVPLRRCLSPMPEETCEEMDCTDSLPSETRAREEVHEDAVWSESLPVETRLRKEPGRHETWSESLPVESRVRERVDGHKVWSESLPVETRVREELARHETSSESLPVESRVREKVHEHKVWSESLPVETRMRKEPARHETSSESLPVESRVREKVDGHSVWSESLPVQTRVREKPARHETSSESLPVESRVREKVHEHKVWSESLPVETRVREEPARHETWSESLPVESRVREKVDGHKVWSESLPVETRLREEPARHETWSESLPVESGVREKVDGHSVWRQSLPVESRTRRHLEGENKWSESLPAQSRLRMGAGGHSVCSESLPVESRVRAEADNGKEWSESLPVESRMRVDKGRPTRWSESLHAESRVREETESLPVESRVREEAGRGKAWSESLPVSARVSTPEQCTDCSTDSGVFTEQSDGRTLHEVDNWRKPAVPATEQQLSSENMTGNLQGALPVQRKSPSSEPQQGASEQMVTTMKGLHRHNTAKDRASICDSQRVLHRTSANKDDVTPVEVLDRTDDKKYNFSSLKEKRREARLAEKNKKDQLLRESSASSTHKVPLASKASKHYEENRKGKPDVEHSSSEGRLCSGVHEDKRHSPMYGLSSTNGRRTSPREETASGINRTGAIPRSFQTSATDSATNPEDVDTKAAVGRAPKADAAEGAGDGGRPQRGGLATGTGPDTATQASSPAAGSGPESPQQILARLEAEPGWQTVRPTRAPQPPDNGGCPEKPSLIPLRDCECYVTETLVLVSEGSGWPPPSPLWVVKPFLYMDGTEIESSEDRLIQRRGNQHRLIIPRLNYVDAGLYKLTLSNDSGQASTQCNVLIKPLSELKAPHFFRPLVRSAAKDGQEAILTTEVRGSPPPSVTWHRGSVELRPSSTVRIRHDPSTSLCELRLLRPDLGAGAGTGAGTGDEAGDRYSCRAVNRHGQAQISVVLGGPEQLEPFSPGDVTADHVTSRDTPHPPSGAELQDCVTSSDGPTLQEQPQPAPDDAASESPPSEQAAPSVAAAAHSEDRSRGDGAEPVAADPRSREQRKPISYRPRPLPAAGDTSRTLRREAASVRGGHRQPAAAAVMSSAEALDAVEAEETAPKEATGEEAAADAQTEAPEQVDGAVEAADQPPAALTELSPPPTEAAPAEDPAPAAAATPADSPPTAAAIPAESPPASAATPADSPPAAAATPADPPPAADAKPTEAAPAAAEEPSGDQPPSVEEALSAVLVVAGCPGRLEGRISGHPKPIIVWQRDGAALCPDGERVRPYHEADGTFGLELAECRSEDVGTYTATASNAAGQAATEAALQLLDTSISGKEWAPDFTTPLLGGKVDEGQSLEMDTHITGVPIPEISWSKDGVPLDASDRVCPGFDGDKATLTVKPVLASDAGKYEITIRNTLGEVSSAVQVKVNKVYCVPQFTEKLTDVQQLASLDAKFSCKVSGTPRPDVQWLFNEQLLKSSKKHKIRRDEDACTLTVRDCGEQDAGAYTCCATNVEGTSQAIASLQLVDKLERRPKSEAPLFLKTIGDCEVFPGMQARFTGCVAGFPEPECEWYRNDVRLYPSDRILMEADGSGLVRLTLRTVDDTDAGRYRLRIHNSEGQAACEADLTYDCFEISPTKPLKDQYQALEKQLKSGIPMPLADPPIISRMVDHQLTLSWRPSPAAGQHIPPTYTVEMAKMPEGDFAVINTGVRGCSVEIKRLEPHCDYKFRVIVENKHGASEPSPHAVAHRNHLVPDPDPENPCLPANDHFRPDSSPLFPRGFDMEKYSAGKPHPPTFLRQESNMQFGVKGRDARLRWYVFGHPHPDMRFTFNNNEIEMAGRFSCSFGNDGQLTLVISSMQERDQGVYEALCTNKYGEARQRVLLRLAEPPRFLQHPEETTVMQREQARFEARVTGVPIPEIRWYKDWQPLAKSKRVRILWREPDTCILLINSCLTPRDRGLYSITATTPVGTTTASAMLHVEYDESMYKYISYSPARSVKPRNKAFEDFCDIGEELGRGTQGIAYHVIQRSNGCSFAAKAMNGKGDLRQAMNSEMWIMNQLHDRQLARLYDAYESPRQLILVQELCSGGDVLHVLCRQPSYNEADVANVVRQTLWGLQHMHLKHIAHLSLTPADILFSRPGGDEVKLIDFSLARHINPGRPERLDFGMPEFVAPEVVNGESVGPPADIWSVGVITYLLLSGTSPFRGDTDCETLKRIQSGEMQHDLEAFSQISAEAKDFISQLLVFQPAGRLDVRAALKHPWLKFAERTPSSVKDTPSDRLRAYMEKFRAWYRNASCRTWFRRRPLSSAMSHPSGMVYPPDVAYTPPPSPEPVRRDKNPPPAAEQDEPVDPLDDELDWIGTESHYQQGPDTYLLQLRDTGLPSRLREYIKVAAERSPTFAQKGFDEPLYDRTLPVLHERRRFTDIMDEEIDDERKSRINKYSADAGHYVPRRLRYELGSRPKALAEADAVREKKRQGQMPFLREKPSDMAIQDGEVCELSCLAVGNPKPIVQWFRNDVVIGETRRIKLLEDSKGRSLLRLQPAKDFDHGVYKVIARNMVGQTVAKCRLYMGYEPGSCDLPDVVDYSDKEVLLRWKVPADNGHAPILGYGLQCKQLIEHRWTDVADNIAHQFFCVHDLQPESNYHFRLSARNKFGWGPHSVPTPTVRTRKAGWSRSVQCTKAEKLLQQMTEAGREPDDLEARPDLDYEAEEHPVTLTAGSPEETYSFLAEIHRGRFSLAAMCVNTETSTIRTAKLLDASEEHQEAAAAEFEALRALRSERIAALYDAYRMDNKYVLVMESLEGPDVLNYFQQQHEYTEEMVAVVINQVLDGLQYLHWRGVAHLDLQPDNVVLASERRLSVKLVDLGSAQRVTRLGRMVRRAGHLEYTAPELLVDEPAFPMTDVWSLGVITYLLLSGVSPFCGETDEETRQNILYVRFRFEHLHKEITNEATRFMMMLFKRAPSKRPTCDQCLEHRWLMSIEYMQKSRERAVFLGHRLKDYSDQYHRERERQATQSTDLIAAFSMDLLT
ncbi:obscurin-like isoform X2 [Pollicipes pollicipes]|uniref:obscurin-like isoform X2 n=1 Tax=Pollicipes pollicipes TaxID=41117 RepID=UPI0018851379|nr:obscurin-like isoform X2 [Pollicipes pollicipes]